MLECDWLFTALIYALREAMASRFASISDKEVKEFTKKPQNENMRKKTLYFIKVFTEYLDACDEKREI